MPPGQSIEMLDFYAMRAHFVIRSTFFIAEQNAQMARVVCQRHLLENSCV
jgi:hypothetical protein